MTGTIFMETLRRNWRAIIYWGLGIGSLAWMQIIILPDVNALQQMADLMATMPPALLQMFGGTDTAFMATPEGYLNLQFFSFMPLVYAIYAVMAGLSVTSGEEDQGIMDMLLSLPLPRWRVIVERFLAYSLIIVIIMLLTVFGLWLGTTMTPVFQISFSTLFISTMTMLPLLLAVMAFTVFAATLVRRRGQAIAAASVFLIAGYFLYVLGQAAIDSLFYRLRGISVFNYYQSREIMINGPVWGDIGLLLGVTVLFVGGAVWFFQHRDIGG